jgi:hypothetical protein
LDPFAIPYVRGSGMLVDRFLHLGGVSKKVFRLGRLQDVVSGKGG